MKLVVTLFTLTMGTVALAGGPRLVHPTCKVAVDHTYTNDGINEFLTKAAQNSLAKKGFIVTDMTEARSSSEPAMALKLDVKNTLKKSRGQCKAILSLRGTLDENEGQMLLADIAKKNGSFKKVTSKCIKAVVKSLEDYPKCSTVLDPDAQPDPGPDDGDDQGGDTDVNPEA